MILNEIITGISEAIKAEFGEDYGVYTEFVEQGLNEPCFSIVCVSPKSSRFLGDRYYKENRFCIHYYASTADVRTECMEVFDRLAMCLNRITVSGDEINGTDIYAEEPDNGVFHVFVNYNLFMREVKEKETMETLSHTGSVAEACIRLV